MKVRVGFGLGVRTSLNDQDGFGALVDSLESLRFDSLWLSERITGECPDPVVALAIAAGRTTRLKLGLSVMVGNMGGSSLAMAPAALIAGYCDHVDLDGPIYLEADESPSADYGAGLFAVPPALWGSQRDEPC